MCKEDVRIGRKKIARRLYNGTVTGLTGGQIAQPNNNRATIIITLTMSDPIVVTDNVIVTTKSLDGAVVGFLSAYHPTLELTVERHGGGCTDPLFVTDVADSGASVACTEFTWNEELKDM